MNPGVWQERADILDQVARVQRQIASNLRMIGDEPGALVCERLVAQNAASAKMCRDWAEENVRIMVEGIR